MQVGRCFQAAAIPPVDAFCASLPSHLVERVEAVDVGWASPVSLTFRSHVSGVPILSPGSVNMASQDSGRDARQSKSSNLIVLLCNHRRASDRGE